MAEDLPKNRTTEDVTDDNVGEEGDSRMKRTRKRYSVDQIVEAIRQHELGVSVADIARKLGIAEQTFYRWKKQYGGLEASEVQEMKQLREENAKLKRLVADLSLDKAMLQDLASKKW